jgi:hypothetical protein
MGVKRKSKGTNGHKLKGPKQGGREDFGFFHFPNLVKTQIWPYKELAKSPILKLPRLDKKQMLDYQPTPKPLGVARCQILTRFTLTSP